MAAPPATASALFASLHIDLLVLVFGQVPLHPRLKVIARVCRRWRSAAYLAVTSIPQPWYYNGPFERYPNLTECAFSGLRGVPSLWTPEQRARIRSADFVLSSQEVLEAAGLSSLTSLRAHLAQNNVPLMNLLVAPNATSLTHLDVGSMYMSLWRPNAELPLLPALPALRSLKLGFPPSKSDSLGRFAPSLSQLTHLTAMFTIREHLAHPLPALRSLRLLVCESVDEDWLPCLPSLTSLEADHLEVKRPVLSDALRAVLRSASVDKDVEHSNLALCPNLRHLYVLNNSLRALRSLATLGGQLTSMEVIVQNTDDAEDVRFLMQTFTALRSLYLRPLGLPDTLPEWRLPYLRKLRADEMPLSWVTLVLRTFPHLEHLELRRTMPMQDVAAFEAEVRAADRRGMQLIDLGECKKADFGALQQSLLWLELRKR